MRLIYLAGPYRAADIRGVQQNIERASNIAYKLWMEGNVVICPHKNTALFDTNGQDDIWLKGDLEILSRCDAVYMMRGWTRSAGCRAEHALAIELKKEIFYQGGETE